MTSIMSLSSSSSSPSSLITFPLPSTIPVKTSNFNTLLSPTHHSASTRSLFDGSIATTSLANIYNYYTNDNDNNENGEYPSALSSNSPSLPPFDFDVHGDIQVLSLFPHVQSKQEEKSKSSLPSPLHPSSSSPLSSFSNHYAPSYFHIPSTGYEGIVVNPSSSSSSSSSVSLLSYYKMYHVTTVYHALSRSYVTILLVSSKALPSLSSRLLPFPPTDTNLSSPLSYSSSSSLPLTLTSVNGVNHITHICKTETVDIPTKLTMFSFTSHPSCIIHHDNCTHLHSSPLLSLFSFLCILKIETEKMISDFVMSNKWIENGVETLWRNVEEIMKMVKVGGGGDVKGKNPGSKKEKKVQHDDDDDVDMDIDIISYSDEDKLYFYGFTRAISENKLDYAVMFVGNGKMDLKVWIRLMMEFLPAEVETEEWIEEKYLR